jgi:hypothetical protein
MYQEVDTEAPERRALRPLPRDDRVLAATSEIRRDLDHARELLGTFGDRYFTADPPDFEGAQRAAQDLVMTAEALRLSARQLRTVTSPLV